MAETLRCSFCNKRQEDVRKLIAGPTVYICDECVEVCNDIIADDARSEDLARDPADAQTPAKVSLADASQCRLCGMPTLLREALAVENRGFLCAGCADAVDAALAKGKLTGPDASAIGYVACLVRDYDEAIGYFTSKVGFHLVEDTPLTNDKRWVVVRPFGQAGASLLLAKASTAEQEKLVGNQARGRVFLFLQTDYCRRDYEIMKARGVTFREEPREETYGTVAVFEDLYGNKWDLLEGKQSV